MFVFRNMQLDSDDENVLKGPGLAVATKVLEVPTVPRSLCEIKGDEDDYQWLCGWASDLTPRDLQRWLYDFVSRRTTALQTHGVTLSYADAAGCLLLLLAAESARRDASEGNLWPTVRRKFTVPVRQFLFDAQGQPKREFKDALEGAARKLNLRHLFGIAGTQNYYISVYLQFGFTRSGIDRLPHWLAGAPASEAVSLLRGDDDTYLGTPNSIRSASFSTLWDTLRGFRSNNITEANARRALAANPWALSNWVDNLIEQSTKSRSIRDIQGGDEQIEPPPLTFLEEPQLRWDSSPAPSFTASIENLADFDLTADRYRVNVGNHRLTTLLRSDAGGYTPTEETITLPSGSPEFIAAINDDNGMVIASQLVQLWNPNEDVELFDLTTGKRLDTDTAQRVSTRNYGLLVSADLTVEPQELPFRTIGAGNHAKRLYLLTVGETRPVSVAAPGPDGENNEIWNSSADAVIPSKPEEPGWAASVWADIDPPQIEWLGNYRRVRITVPADIAVQYVRVGGKPLNFTADGDTAYRTEAFDISNHVSMTPPHVLRVHLGLRRGAERTTVVRSCAVNARGVMRVRGDGWEVVNPLATISTGEALHDAFKLVASIDANQVSGLALMEGSVYLRPAWSRPRNLGVLAGYGSPLEVRPPYNAADDSESIVIGKEVRKPGILEGVTAGAEGELCLTFTRSLEPGADHAVVVWSIGSQPHIYQELAGVEHRGVQWRLPGVDYPGDSCCVGVCYQGASVGAWWPNEIYEINVDDDTSAAATAAMLRWVHAPIVAPSWLEMVRSFAHQNPVQTLAAWFMEEGLPDGLAHTASTSEQWGTAVREIFAGWEPSADIASEALHKLGDGESDDERVCKSVELLLREAPLLTGRLIRMWLVPTGVPDQRQISRAKRNLLEHLRFIIADVPEESISKWEWEQWEKGELCHEPQPTPLSLKEKQDFADNQQRNLLDAAAGEMRVDSRFIDSIIGKVLDPLDYSSLDYRERNNAETALNNRPFRELLGLRILASMNQGG